METVTGICFNSVMSSTGTNGSPRATIREIASAAGVSIATVSRVLNERPGVADETRGAVLRVVRDRKASPRTAARVRSRAAARG